MILSWPIDAKEEKDIALIDIPNDFIQTGIENEKYMAIIKIREILLDMLLDTDFDVCGTYVTTDRKGIMQMINQCINTIYGIIVVSLLYYCKFLRLWN